MTSPVCFPHTLPPGEGLGKAGFSIPPREGLALDPFGGGGLGKAGFPSPLFESLCSRETVMRMAHHAAMHMPWERGRPARATAPRAR